MNKFRQILDARHNFEKSRHALILAGISLDSTGMFKETIKEIDDTVIDFNKVIDQLTKHIED